MKSPATPSPSMLVPTAPPCGGTGDAHRITYQAALGEQVTITGAEPIKGWKKDTHDTWQVVLPNAFFGPFNPYSDLIHGDWFQARKRQHHTGAVYLNGDWLTEAAQQKEVMKPVGSNALWFATVSDTHTTIWAQFKGVNPNEPTSRLTSGRRCSPPKKLALTT